MVMYYELSWLGTGADALVLAGPVPPTFDVQIGNRFAVWAELVGTTYDVIAYDFDNPGEIQVTSTPGKTTLDRNPATSGPWIVWQHQDGATTTIQAKNMDTSAEITVNNGAGNFNPSIDGNLIAWESDVTGNLDIWIYRKDDMNTGDGQSFQVTTGPEDEYLNDVFGDMVAYVDASRGDEDIYVSKLEFSSDSFNTPGFQPSGLAYDGANLYVSEMSGDRTIYKMDIQTGAVISSFPAPGNNPNGLAYDGNGHLFVIDIDSTVYEIDTSGAPIGQFTIPFRGGGIAFDGTYIYVSDFDSNEVNVMDRNGVFVRDFLLNDSNGDAIRPADMVFDPINGHLLVIDEFNKMISKVATTGEFLCQIEGPRDPGVQGLGGITIVNSTLYIAGVSDPDPFDDNYIPGTIYFVPQFNCSPVANSGPDQTVQFGNSVTLDGSGSMDPDEDHPLTYAWEIISKPDGSSAVLNNPNTVNPSFTPDISGNYTIQLIVTDALGFLSAPDTVTVDSVNTAPNADAGEDQAITIINTAVQLDGTQSWDPDGDNISYLWTITSKPAGSGATLSDSSIATPTFVADVKGTYEVELVVTDFWGLTNDPVVVMVSFSNVPPVADAGNNQAVSVGDLVNLDGSGSSDANYDPLTYSWSFVSTPEGSTAALLNAATAHPSFTADMAGTYEISLVVNDGLEDSFPVSVSVTATSTQSNLIDIIKRIIYIINNDIDPDNLKNSNMVNALTNKLNSVLAMIDDGSYQEALDQLENDILGKTDGCAVSEAPDRNNWLEDCGDQNLVFPLVVEAIELLKDMI